MATETQEVLAQMLVENTGRDILDSGGACGRNWQRNKDKTAEDFLAEPFQTARFSQHGIETSLSVFHWLDDILDYDKEMDDLFYGEFLEESDPEGTKYWYENLQEFPDWLMRRGWGVPADAEFQFQAENTGNYEDALSQTIQFSIIYAEQPNEDGEPYLGDYYVALEIHGGYDIRGGYTKPRFFRVAGEVYDMYQFADVRISTVESLENENQLTLDGSYPKSYISWYSPNAGYSWEIDDRDVPPLNEMEFVDVDEREEDDEDLANVYYNDEGKGFVQYRGRLIGLE